jgi:hypothetical protein
MWQPADESKTNSDNASTQRMEGTFLHGCQNLLFERQTARDLRRDGGRAQSQAAPCPRSLRFKNARKINDFAGGAGHNIAGCKQT